MTLNDKSSQHFKKTWLRFLARKAANLNIIAVLITLLITLLPKVIQEHQPLCSIQHLKSKCACQNRTIPIEARVMAHLSQRRSENVSGDFYVDATCIDCDTCRWMVPEVYQRVGDQSAVYHQPGDTTERLRAMQALLSCPTASIGTVDKPTDIKAVQASFPIPIADNVFHCGYHAESSYGAASYLIQRPSGNVLVDSPRFTPPLLKQIEAMGGIRYLYLTHQDDVADHEKFHRHFGCDRILHQADINSGTRQVEIQLSGEQPVSLDDELLIIPVPGHTQGHTVLLYADIFLFTGDHLAWSIQLNHLAAFRSVCWYSWTELKRSMQRLATYSFEWVLPGHGRRYHADRTTMQQQMQQCLAWMETV